MMSQVHPLAACPNRSYLKAHGFELDRYIEHPLILEQGMAISVRRATLWRCDLLSKPKLAETTVFRLIL
jgi:hypothetical protein